MGVPLDGRIIEWEYQWMGLPMGVIVQCLGPKLPDFVHSLVP